MTSPRFVALRDVCSQDRTNAKALDHRPVLGLDQISGDDGKIYASQGSKAAGGEGNYFVYDERHILFSKLRPYLNKVGKPSLAGRCSTELVPLLPNTQIMREYLFYLLRSPRMLEAAIASSTGARMPRANLDVLLSEKIALPPLDEQQRIVDILDRAASIQRLRQTADQKLKEIIPALFVDMFGDPATNPKGMPLVKLDEIIDRIETGKNITAGSGISDYSILKVSAVTSGVYKEHESKPAPDDHTIIKSHIVQKDDFLFSRANTVELVGATALVHQTDGKTLLPDKLWRICWRANISPRYMLAVMQNKDIRNELGRASSGTSASMRNISQGRLASIEIPLAPFEQQLRFAKIAEALTAKAEMSQEANQYAQSAAAALAQTLLG